VPETVSIAFPVPLRRTFTYSVPGRWREGSLVGFRATAPLGGRTLYGVVVEDDPAVPEGVALREVTSVLDDAPSVDAELRESTRILAERFFAPWGELLRAALPARLPSGEGTRYEITGAGAAAVFDAPPSDRFVLEELLESGRVGAPALAELAEGGRERLRALELRGWIRPVGKPAREPKGQVLVSLLAHGDDARTAAGRSKKAAEALRFLESLGRPALSEELGAAGFSPALVRKLAEKGAVSLVSHDRRPDEAAAGPPAAPASPFTLSPEQAAALATVEGAVAAREFSPFLLFGVTGSGKTEIYLRAIAAARAAGRGAVWLVPEIALTPIFARSLRERFGDEAVVLHSAVGEANRARAWKDMKEGRARVVIGPRTHEERSR